MKGGTEDSLKSGMLRFITAGSVDDGKSTLIGRLLYDSKSLFDEQYSDIKKGSQKQGREEINWALATDGLKEERAAGITIDVAYRYFSTPKRKFILADCPGHKEFTRNMVTGASTAQAVLILIDAQNGIVEQTKRHSALAALLQMPKVIVCINKMDLVQYDEHVFNKIKIEYEKLCKLLKLHEIEFIPMSALRGDNVVDKSTNMSWYKGESLLQCLENISIKTVNSNGGRFAVQYMLPSDDNDFQFCTGRVASGTFKKGEMVTILPSGRDVRISKILSFNNELISTSKGGSVCMALKDTEAISRGDLIISKNNRPTISSTIKSTLCWFNQTPLNIDKEYILRLATTERTCTMDKLFHKLDISTMEQISGATIAMNDIATVHINTSAPLIYDNYDSNTIMGSFILIDPITNSTVAAGIIE